MKYMGWLGLVMVKTLICAQTDVQSREASMSAYKMAISAEPGARDAALKSLVETGHADVAADAAAVLIRLNARDVEAPILDLIPRLSDSNMQHVLTAAQTPRDAHLRMSLSRAVLARTANEATTSGTAKSAGGLGAAGVAAMLLANSKYPEDSLLIGRALRAKPRDPGLWLAVARMGIADKEQLSLAHSVIEDEKVSVRLAASAALAPADPGARDFVVTTLKDYFDRFGPTDAALIVGNALKQSATQKVILGAGGAQIPSSYESDQASQLMYGLGSIGTLEFLQTPDAEQLTFAYINSPNELVRRALGLVAVMRWPERFLGLQSSHLDERTKLLAALSVYHPDLLPQIQAIMSPEELDRIRQQLMKDGIESMFYLPGDAGLVF